jgi:hypothetical protein
VCTKDGAVPMATPPTPKILRTTVPDPGAGANDEPQSPGGGPGVAAATAAAAASPLGRLELVLMLYRTKRTESYTPPPPPNVVAAAARADKAVAAAAAASAAVLADDAAIASPSPTLTTPTLASASREQRLPSSLAASPFAPSPRSILHLGKSSPRKKSILHHGNANVKDAGAHESAGLRSSPLRLETFPETSDRVD